MERVQRLPASPWHQAGICKTYQGDKKPDDIQGIRFTKDGQTFKASQISREFSFARLNAQLSWKPSETQQESEHKVQQRIPNGGHLFESTGPGLFSPTNGTAPEELLSQEELLRKRKKRKEERIRAVACPFFIQIIH